jgi:hypothetical protein
LTVEEAAKHLRIGRTKAYALAQEWRNTGGKSGLPVVDFGHVLRVPRHQLELLIGGPLDTPGHHVESTSEAQAADRERREPAVGSSASATRDESNGATRNHPRKRNDVQRDNQLDFFSSAAND